MTPEELDEIDAAGPGSGLRASCEEPRYQATVAAFIAHAREDFLRLVAALRGSEPVQAAELLPLDDDRLIAMERSFSVGVVFAMT